MLSAQALVLFTGAIAAAAVLSLVGFWLGLFIKFRREAQFVPATPPPAFYKTSTTTLRPGKLFCFFKDLRYGEQDLCCKGCDYLIYTGLSLTNQKTYAYRPAGEETWDVFMDMLKNVKSGSDGGLAFPTISTGSYMYSSTLDMIEQSADVPELLKEQPKLVALGTIGHQTDKVNLRRYYGAYRHIKKLLKGKDNAMSFLGAKVTSRSLADKLVEELLEHLGSNVDTVIVESYIAPTGSVGCRVFPTSVYSSLAYQETNLPSLEVAAHTVNRSRDEGDVYRIVFASTLATVVYIKGPRQRNSTNFGDECGTSFLTDAGADCDVLSHIRSTTYAHTSIEDISTYSYADHGRRMYVFETILNLFTKYKKYMPKYSDGWALYDVDMDKLDDCTTTLKPYYRIERTRVVVADRSNTHVPVDP
ncbi:hypothetical protein MTO96_034064, partial [Rhipicephalus appendiculatus]